MLKTQWNRSLFMCNGLLLITTSFGVKPVHLVATKVLQRNQVMVEPPSFSVHEEINMHETLPYYLDENSEEDLLLQPQINLNSKGAKFVSSYLKTCRANLVVIKKRSPKPFYIIDSIFGQYGLPPELKYLAVIESELKPSAKSYVGARGPWQLMPATAHILGLKTSKRVDERTNYYKSTIAAARYLKDLYALFGDWLLVVAAYNGGPGPVYHAMKKSGSKNFWVLQAYLPAESRNHVKKFIATHYFFEGRGSETTLTREENTAYKKMVDGFVKSGYPIARTRANSQNVKTKAGLQCALAANTKTCLQSINNDKPEKQKEGSIEKFSRLMKASEEGLRKSQFLCNKKAHGIKSVFTL